MAKKRICDGCGNAIPSHKNADSRYCSQSCGAGARMWEKRQRDKGLPFNYRKRDCEGCGAEFQTPYPMRSVCPACVGEFLYGDVLDKRSALGIACSILRNNNIRYVETEDTNEQLIIICDTGIAYTAQVMVALEGDNPDYPSGFVNKKASIHIIVSRTEARSKLSVDFRLAGALASRVKVLAALKSSGADRTGGDLSSFKWDNIYSGYWSKIVNPHKITYFEPPDVMPGITSEDSPFFDTIPFF